MKIVKILGQFVSIAVLAFSIASCAIVQGKSSPEQYTNDAAITTKIKAKFVQSDTLSAPAVHVETQNGIVQISGFVSNRAQINTATNIARSVEGVKNVVNDLQVSSRQRSRH